MIEPPIVQTYERQMRDKIKKETKKELQESFVVERWHAISILIALSLVCSIFYSQILYGCGLLVVALIIEPLLNREPKEHSKSEEKGENIGIVDVGEEQ